MRRVMARLQLWTCWGKISVLDPPQMLESMLVLVTVWCLLVLVVWWCWWRWSL